MGFLPCFLRISEVSFAPKVVRYVTYRPLGRLIGSLFYIEEPPRAPPDSPWALPESPHTSAGALQELPQMLLKSPRVSQSPPRGSEYLPSSLEPILGGSSALKCDACAQKLAVWNTATDSPGDGEVVARSAARSPSPHAPGARMTVVYTNSLKLNVTTQK